jgi:hypothetical protein
MTYESNMTEMGEGEMGSPAAPAGTPRKPSPAMSSARKAYLDSPVKTVLGLLVLWGSLMLIFKAHRISDAEIRLTGAPQVVQAAGSKAPGPLLEACVVALPGGDSSPREALEKVAASFALEVGQDDLKKLGEKPKAFDIKGVPLYKALHTLVGDPAVGYALQGKAIRLFNQKLENRKNLLNWQAELPLSDTPMAIFPSGDFDLWFTIHLVRDSANLQDPWRTLQMEIWKGGVHRNTLTQTLDTSGKGMLSMSSPKENISFQLERKAPPKGSQAAGRYQMMLTYQAFE